MMKKITALLAFFCLLISVLNAQNYTLVDNNFDRVQIRFTSAEISSYDIHTEQGWFSRVAMPSTTPSRVVGSPELPILTELMEIPLCDNVSYEIISSHYNDFSGEELGIHHPLYPAQPDAFKSQDNPPFTRNAAVYQTDAFTTHDVIRVEKTGILRNMNLATVYFYPIQYNPATDTYRVFSDVEVVFSFENADIPATYEMKNLHGNSIFNGLHSKVMNPIQPTRESIFEQPIKYLIVANSMFRDGFDDFVNWKKRCGFNVEVAYTDDPGVGTTTTSIAAFIKGKYTNATVDNPAPTFVLLIGDIAQVPVFNGQSDNHKTDLYYFTWTDGDNIPDCFYGRFSVQNATQLQTVVGKTLQYEQMTMPDPTYLDKAVLVAGTDNNWSPTHANGQMNYLHDNYINEGDAGYETVYLHLYNSSNQAATIRQEIGAGVGYANYTAHCSEDGWADPEFVTSQVPAMSNLDKYCFMVGNCCLSNKFDENECFGEAVTRTADKGAVAYIGGTNSTLWDEDFYWSVGVRSNVTANPDYDASRKGAYDRMFHTHGEAFSDWYITGGSMITAGNLSVEASSSSNKLYYWEIYHILGDPSMMPWYTQPEEMEVTALDVLMAGTTTLDVTAVPYAYVALTADGEAIAAATADATGAATLTFAAAEPGINYELAVSAQHYQTYFQTITAIVPEGSYVVTSNPRITNDVEPNYSMTLTYDVTLRNLGVAGASSITSTLSTASTDVTINNNSVSLASLAQGAEEFVPSAFGISIADNVADGTIAQFTITTQYDGNQTTTTNFNQMLRAPILRGGLVQSAEVQGNNNGANDPGETCALRITTVNTGHAAAVGVYSTLSCAYDKVTIQDDNLYLGDIAANSSAVSEFTIQLANDVPNPFIIPFIQHVWAGAYSYVDTVYLFVGSAVEDFESATLTEFPWSNSSNPWYINSSNPYEGTYCVSPKTGMSQGNKSTLSLSIQATANDSISYYRRLSTSAYYGSHELRFFIDGVQMECLTTSTGWSRAAFPISAGTHTIKFELYNGAYFGGSYNAGVDFINFPMYGDMAPLAIQESAGNTFSIYPNPTVDKVNISLPEYTKGMVTISLFDLNGKKLSSVNVDSSNSIYSMDIHSLANGMYIISIFNDEGVYTGKIIKK